LAGRKPSGVQVEPATVIILPVIRIEHHDDIPPDDLASGASSSQPRRRRRRNSHS
jgi:hypothetical protein